MRAVLVALFIALMWPLAAAAQQPPTVVSKCGTVPAGPWNPGAQAPQTVDTNGNVCVNTGGGSSGPAPAAIYSNQALIATPGTAVQLPSQTFQNGVVITALPTNTGNMTIGGSSVTSVTNGTGNGYVLTPGQSISYAISNLNLIYINGTAGNGVSWTGN